MNTEKSQTPAAIKSLGFLSCHIKSWQGNLKDNLNPCPSAILPLSNFLSFISVSLKLSLHNIYLAHVGSYYFMYVLQVNKVFCLFTYQKQNSTHKIF